MTDEIKKEEVVKSTPSTPATPHVEKPKPTKLNIKLLTDQIHSVDGKDYYLVVTVDGELRGFLVPVESIDYDISKTQSVEPSECIEIYNWKKEIDGMIPSISDVKRNVLLSFWRAGAISLSSISSNQIKRRMFDSAFPYKPNFEESK